MCGGDESIRYLSAVISEDNPTHVRCIKEGAPEGRGLRRRKMNDGKEGERKRMVIWGTDGKTRLIYRKTRPAVSGLFFNESVENETGREKERERGAPIEKWNFSVGKWNFERIENLREECQPSYVPQTPSGDFAGVSILSRAGRW